MAKRKVIVKISTKRREISFVLPYGDYLIENWGSPFIVVFIALLISAATYLSINNEAIANYLAVYAYYFLVIGVVLQIASYVY